jgi:hypothetical protein
MTVNLFTYYSARMAGKLNRLVRYYKLAENNDKCRFGSHNQYVRKATVMAQNVIMNVWWRIYFSESSSRGYRIAIAETVQEQDRYNQQVSVTPSTRTFDDFAPESALAAKKYCRLH